MSKQRKRSRQQCTIEDGDWFDWDLPYDKAQARLLEEEKLDITVLGKFILVPLESSYVEESEEYTEFYAHPIVCVDGKSTILRHRFDYEIDGDNNLIIYV